ncbi:MAG: FAD-dependent oxidoreductase [Sulfuricella sp.]|nr:FAD-dependent oxidoreductase [Sulfuricella sp.]
MPEQTFSYVVIGGGLAGASAIAGIRERDANGTILLIGDEMHLPYDRPPLSKQLWFGKSKVAEVFLHDQAYYDQQGVSVVRGAKVAKLDPGEKTIADAEGNRYRFDKLLLATGVTPRRLDIPGGNSDGICYFRTLDDYLSIHSQVATAKSALVIGGGFIGSELAAALNVSLEVTMIFPGTHICSRVFPGSLGQAMQRRYQERGIYVLDSEMPVSIGKTASGFVTQTSGGKTIQSDLVLVGIGTVPNVDLAQAAGLAVDNGIVVDEFLQTSHPDIYAAGDNAFFPYAALGQGMRIEHWDNALNQGKWAGRNMAGAREAFTYQPYFFSDLFEFGYEATGLVSPKLETVTDWRKENETGVIYYLADQKIRGIMLCNVWDKMDIARELIRKGESVSAEALHGMI